MRFDDYPQSPTYYSSTGCGNSYAVVDSPSESACIQSLPGYPGAWG